MQIKGGPKRTQLLAGAAFAVLTLAAAAPQAASAQSAGGEQRVEEVVVTARRSEERLRDVPLTVTAITAGQLETRSISGLEGVAQYTPGLRFAEFVSAFNNVVTLRGLQQINTQNPIGNVGVFIDGVYLQRNYMVNPSLGDFERVEVVKGPQSALYGQNTFAGAINYVTKKPTQTFSANGSATVGAYGQRELQVAVGGPIIPGILAMRAYGGTADFNGSWKNNYPGVNKKFSRLGGYNRQSWSVSGLFTPVEQFSLEVAYQNVRRDEEIRPYYTIDGNLVEDRYNCATVIAPQTQGSLWCGDLPSNPDARRSGVGSPPKGVLAVPQPDAYNSAEIWRATATFSPTEDLDLIYTYGSTEGQGYEQFSFQSNPYNATGRTTITVQKEGGVLHYTSHEARAVYTPQGPLSAELGYYHSWSRDEFVFGQRQAPIGTPVQLLSRDPLGLTGTPTVSQNKDAHYRVDSFFGRLSYKFLSERATVSAELRHTTTDLDLNDKLARATNPALPILAATYKDYTPRFSAQYRATDDVMFYASAARGVKAGGFNGYVSGTAVLLPSEQGFGPEKNWTYEIGMKGVFFDRRVTADLSAFYVDWMAKQSTVVPANSPNTTQQGLVPPRIYGVNGSATAYGVELSGAYYAMPGLRFDYAVSYIDPRYGPNTFAPEYARTCDNIVCPKTGALEDNVLEGVSRLSGTLGVEYRTTLSSDLDFFIGGDTTYRGKQYANSINITTIPEVWLANARMGIEKGGWRAFIWGRNLADNKYVSATFAIPTILQYNVNLGERRTFGVTVSARY